MQSKYFVASMERQEMVLIFVVGGIYFYGYGLKQSHIVGMLKLRRHLFGNT